MDLDIVYILPFEGYRFLVVGKCDLSGRVKEKPLCTLSSWIVTDFLWDDVICCYTCFGKLVIDGRSENNEAVAELPQK